jgi:hypothetical protein
VMADARHTIGDPQAGGRRHPVVLPTALRLTVTRHLSQCGTCQRRRDDFMAWWAPLLLPILADIEPDEQVTEAGEPVTEDLHPGPELTRPHAPGPPGRGPAVVTAATAVVRQPAMAAGAGLLVALLVLAFVWPGFLHGTPATAPRGGGPSSPDSSSSSPSSGGAPQVTETIDGVPGRNNGRRVRAGAGLLTTLPPAAAGSSAGPSLFASPTPPLMPGVQPSATSPAARQTSGTSPTRWMIPGDDRAE